MALYRRLHALASRGVGLLALVAVIAILIGLAGLWMVERELIARAGEGLALGAMDVAGKLDSQVAERVGDLDVLASAPQLRMTDMAAVRAHLETVQRAYPVYARLALADRTGRVVASTDHEWLGRDVRHSSWFQAVWHVPGAHVEPVIGGDAGSGLAAVVFSAPVKSAAGAFQGVIMTEVDRGYWRKVVSDTVDQFGGQAQHFGLVRYRVLDHAGEGLLTAAEEGEPPGNLRRLGLPSAVRVAANRPGWIEEEHFVRKVPVITGYARMRGARDSEALQWGILVRADRREVLANIQGILFKLAFTGCTAFLPLVGLVAWANARQRQEEEKSAQAQRALAESEARTRTILDNAMDAVIVMNAQGLIAGWNKQAERIFGWPAQEVLGHHLATRMVPSQHRDAHNRGLAQYLTTGEGPVFNKRIEITALRKGGAEFPIELAVIPVQTEQGVLFSAFVRDITEAQLRERQNQMEHAFSKALAGTAVIGDLMPMLLETIGTGLGWAAGVWWGPDAAASRLCCRAAWASDSSRSAEFLKSTGRIDFEPGIGLPGRVWQSRQPAWIPDVQADANFPRVSAAQAAGLHGALAIPIVAGGEIAGVLEFFSTAVQSADQGLLDVLAWIGTRVGSVVERRQAEQARRDSDAQMRAVVSGALDAIVLMDGAGRIAGWNRRAEEIFGWPEADVLGRDLSLTIVPPPFREAHRAGLANYLATGEGPVLNQMIEITAVRKDGSEFPVELTITPLQVESGTMFSAFLRDITARKQMVERLNEREMFFRLLSEQLPVGVFEINTAGACLYTNKMWELICRGPGGLAGDRPSAGAPSGPWTQWFHADDRPAVEQAWANTTSAYAPIRHECRLAAGREDVQWVQVLLWPMVTDTGVRYLGTIEDITARKRTIAHTMQLLRQGRFELQTLSEAKHLAELLAYAFPDPARAQLGITELLVNGVEHGNLGISYDEKTRLLEQGALDEELARRLALPDYAHRRVRVATERTGTELTLAIVDDGQGFDWKQHLDLADNLSGASHGRGIAMSRLISFDHLEYRDRGNHVVVTTYLDHPPAGSGGPERAEAA